MPQWLIYLRIALTVIAIIRELKSGGELNAKKVLTAVAAVVPERYRPGLYLLSPEDIRGIQTAFLTLGDLVAEPKSAVDNNKPRLD
jgi:hypothetical protein